ncbi:hypothetical protein SAMN05216236_105170 [Sedimentitalea nanhaiensis]|uniref:Uncharacterized protein n=1 Tax=Sedimentitalea nanhaiensis TaxID=999627 RepID=A0A1I7A3R6_9RHOB|nr:hypothetical protein SAMN05216236_105170 [Sedimentitalea nanhaiensis]
MRGSDFFEGPSSMGMDGTVQLFQPRRGSIHAWAGQVREPCNTKVHFPMFPGQSHHSRNKHTLLRKEHI